MRSLPVADPGVPDHRSATRYLWWLAVRTWPSLAAGIAWGIVWMLSQALTPAVIGKAVDAGLVDRDREALLTWGTVLLGLGLVQATTGILRHRVAVFNWLGAAYRTVQVTIAQANRLGATLPKRLATGEVVSIGTADINHIGNALDITARGTGAVVAIVAIAVILFSASVPLGLVVVIGVPVLMALVGGLIRPLHRRQQAYRDEQGHLTTRAGDIVTGLRVVRGVGGEATFAARYRADSQTLRSAGVRVARVESVLEAAQVLLPGAFVVLVVWLGARFALRGEITPGQLVAFYGYASFLVSPLRTITEAIDKMTRGHVAARRVVALLDLRRELPEPDRPARLPEGEGDLVDEESGLVVRPGRLTAVAANAPEEAAAIADRLGRYVDGEVTLCGVPLRDLPLATVRERILVADNDGRLFSGPLREELGGDPSGRDDERIAAALAAASAADIVAALPHGLDTVVAERGREFSGGQQQRLRLVRALVTDPQVLVLVEPTSAVDAHTEARIAERLGVARAGRATVVCSTSPLVLDRADHVVFVEGGKVAAEGSHRELLATEPRYAAVVTRGEET
ncbi:ABC transporter ATP-binding protein [Phytohabitans kaempferiae]|uniref:ABC transporter ATP-binding protein n=1 Tax=Phytohabitans kaempferiae TaxID=1620943 RepID=A0ABV6LVY2_9ACTN